jgi:hypothetical protein
MDAAEKRSADFHARALGLLGLGRSAEARAALAAARSADPDNVAAALLSRSLAAPAPNAAAALRP